MVGLVERLDPQVACGTTELRYPNLAERLELRKHVEVEIDNQGALAVDGGCKGRSFLQVELEGYEFFLDPCCHEKHLVFEGDTLREKQLDDVFHLADLGELDIHCGSNYHLRDDRYVWQVGTPSGAGGVLEELKDEPMVARELNDGAVERYWDGCALLRGGNDWQTHQ